MFYPIRVHWAAQNENYDRDEIFIAPNCPFQHGWLKGNVCMEVDLLPFDSSGCILRSAQPASALQFDYFRPKALSCLHEVSDVRHTHTHAHKKLPKQIMPAPVTCRALCAISYLPSMQQQRLDEKLILPSSLCLFLSVSLSVSSCLYLSVHLCPSLPYFSLCLHRCLDVRRMASRSACPFICVCSWSPPPPPRLAGEHF